MVIGVDLDDVLGDFFSSFIGYHNKNYGTSWSRETMNTYYFHELTGESRETIRGRIFEYYNSEEFKKILPIKGAKKALLELTKEHDLVVITSRPEFVLEKTQTWVEEHYSGIFNEICATNGYLNKEDERKRDKSYYCLKYGVSIMIDDFYGFVDDCNDKNIKVLLYDTPWNQDVLMGENLIRVNSWKEISENIKLLANLKTG